MDVLLSVALVGVPDGGLQGPQRGVGGSEGGLCKADKSLSPRATEAGAGYMVGSYLWRRGKLHSTGPLVGKTG